MVKLWDRLRGDAELPDVSAVQGHDLERIRDKLLMLEVVWENDQPRYLIRFHGVDFERINQRNCVGRFLDESMPPPVRERGMQIYRGVMDSRRPSFGVTAVRSPSGETLSYERLLLPFTATGNGVERIFSVITLFAEDNSSPFNIMHAAASLAE
jgi:hypothetical protein